jgi:predicted PurR-regulated permease PerM
VRGRANKWFLLALGSVALYLCYLIAKPFLGPIFAAIVLAIIFYPLYVRIESVTRRPNLAATISTILVIVVVAVPTLFLGLAITRELHELYRYLSEKSAPQGGVSSYLMNLLEASSRVLGRHVDLSHVDLRSTVLRWIDETARYLGAVGVRAASGVFSVILGIVAVFFTLFFLFRDAPKILRRVAGLVLLTVQQTARLGTGIKQTIVAMYTEDLQWVWPKVH